MTAPESGAKRSLAFRIVGWAIGGRLRAALIATRDTLDEALASPSALPLDQPEGMTREQLIRGYKREREHALDLEREIEERERVFGAPAPAPAPTPPLSVDLTVEANAAVAEAQIREAQKPRLTLSPHLYDPVTGLRVRVKK